MKLIYVHSAFASSFTCPPVHGAQMQNNFKYVNNIHNFILFTINCVEFHSEFFYDDFIYIHTTHILIPSLKTEHVREKLLPKNRVRAIQEVMRGFLLKEVTFRSGEYLSR
jgi:hypothetical protein